MEFEKEPKRDAANELWEEAVKEILNKSYVQEASEEEKDKINELLNKPDYKNKIIPQWREQLKNSEDPVETAQQLKNTLAKIVKEML